MCLSGDLAMCMGTRRRGEHGVQGGRTGRDRCGVRGPDSAAQYVAWCARQRRRLRDRAAAARWRDGAAPVRRHLAVVLLAVLVVAPATAACETQEACLQMQAVHVHASCACRPAFACTQPMRMLAICPCTNPRQHARRHTHGTTWLMGCF
eukprot:353532-Chlamydomonas_euryale.AAC.4